MVETRTIAFVAVLLVLAAVAAPYASPTGFATASGCTGKPVLTLSKDLIQAGSTVVARVKGMENCMGQQIALRKDSCYGNSLATITCADSKCANSVGFTVDAARQDYLIYACIDSYKDGTYWRAGQTSVANLKVVSLPDLTVKSIVAPKFITPNAQFNVETTFENTGLLAATYAKYDVKIYTTTDSVNAVKTASGTISLSPKGNQAIRLPVSLGKGSYVVKATVGKTDAGEWQFNEWNTGNNALSLKLTV